MCGEKISAATDSVPWSGSPPHVRGKGIVLRGYKFESGITPACAGKRSGIDNATVSLRDHPRMCGEKTERTISSRAGTGSPPHVRGKEGDDLRPAGPAGITPACAGKSRGGRHILCDSRDHPRMCGEKTERTISSRAGTGSPPHVRGKDLESIEI